MKNLVYSLFLSSFFCFSISPASSDELKNLVADLRNQKPDSFRLGFPRASHNRVTLKIVTLEGGLSDLPDYLSMEKNPYGVGFLAFLISSQRGAYSEKEKDRIQNICEKKIEEFSGKDSKGARFAFAELASLLANIRGGEKVKKLRRE